MARVAIIGAGAMGSVYAGLMAAAGHEVTAITLWEEHASAISERGLRVEGASGDRTVRLHATTTTNGIGARDLIIIATKAADVESAATAATMLMADKTIVQTIQNGLCSADKVAPIVGADRLAIGVVGGFGASLRAPGHAHHNGMEMLRFGSYAGLTPADLDAGAEVWRSSGFKATTFDDTDQMVWGKLVMNVAFSATTCLSGKTIGEVMADPDMWFIARSCTEEAASVAKARGIDLNVGDPIEHVRSLGSRIPDARPSMLLDHLDKRRSEIEVINGAIPPEADRVGLNAPVNATVSSLVRSREHAFPT